MKKNNNDEPRDEFDHVMLPAFMAKPLGFFQNSAGGPSARTDGGTGQPDSSGPDPYDPDSYATASDSTDTSRSSEATTDASAQHATPTRWWSGVRGRTLIYIGGTVIWLFIQSRN